MSNRRVVPFFLSLSIALLFFSLGSYLTARQNADSADRLAELRAEVDLLRHRDATATAGTVGRRADARTTADDEGRASLIADVKRQLGQEMGLLPVTLLRERSNSFVE